MKLIKIRHYLEYLLLKFFIKLTSLFSWQTNLFLGRKFGVMLYYILPYWRRITFKNLSFVYPQLKKIKLKKMALTVYQNFGMSAFEFLQLKRIHSDNIDHFVEIDGLKNFDEAINKKKGVMLLIPHMDNWELMLIALILKGYQINGMERPQNNVFVNRWINETRREKGAQMLSRGKGNRQAFKVLKEGKILALLIDQNAALYGVFVDFFGKLASTAKGPALLALHTDAAVVFLYSKRLQDVKKHYIKILPAVELIRNGNKEQDILLNTAKFTKIIENFIRENSSQWLWLHPRWKTRPNKEENFY